MKKLVIANRGEIARRILRSARGRGYTVAVISTPEDADALVRLEADDVLEVASFLDAEVIVSAAKKWNASLLHPGYGFLSENADFAEAVESASIGFVGPTADAMRQLGNKESAKALAEANAVLTLPSVRSDALDELEASGIEPPYLVKAAGGGGGRGMRIAETRDALAAALERASEEAAAGFSDATVFIERFLPNPRHIELQVFGDGQGKGVVLGERECSMQRRYQKVIEEAPSPVVDAPLRTQMGKAALTLVEKTRYRGAGTVEFLLDDDGQFYFLEVNTRLQVEHPVTEAVYDIDLVSAQLELAEGKWPAELPTPGSEPMEPRHWSIEARVLAEDPRADFLPTPGPLLRYREPSGEGVRVDSGVRSGGRVHAQFDSMIAKVIATAETRAEAIERLATALASFVVHGTTTNIPFLQAVLRHPDFRSGDFSTRWIGDNLEELNRPLLPKRLEARLSTPGFREQLSVALRGPRAIGRFAARFRGIGNDRAVVGSEREQRVVEVDVDPVTGRATIWGDGIAHALAASTMNLRFAAALEGTMDQARREPSRVRVEATATVIDPSRLELNVFGETLRLEDPRALSHRRIKLAASDGEVRAPMAGKVLEIRVEEGAIVEEGELLIVVESMKMQLEVHAPIAGRVEKLLVTPGEVLDGPDVMAVLVP